MNTAATALAIKQGDRQLLADLSEAIDDRTDLGDGDAKQRKFWKRASDLVSRLSSNDAVVPAPHVFVRVHGGLVTGYTASGPVVVEILDADNWECVWKDGTHDAQCTDHAPGEFDAWVRRNKEADALTEFAG